MKETGSTFPAEPLARRIRSAARGADHSEPGPALAAELLSRGVLVLAPEALHPRVPGKAAYLAGPRIDAGCPGSRRRLPMSMSRVPSTRRIDTSLFMKLPT